jgi:hypothetical protein
MTCSSCTIEVRHPVAIVRHRHECANGEGVERRPIRASDVLAIEVSCVGFRRDHHRVVGELIATNAGRGARLCRDCWRAWRAEVDR